MIEDLEPEVLESYELYGHLALASELWRLAGHPARASAIDDVVSRAYDYDIPLLTTEDIASLVELIAGLPAAVVGTLTDEDQIIPAERLPELRTRAKLVDLGEHRGADAVFAVQEAIIDVENLQGALRSALDLGAHIVFG